MFGQSKPGIEDDIMSGDVKAENAIGLMLPILQELSNFVKRCGDITINLIHQLASLYHRMGKVRSLFSPLYNHVSRYMLHYL